jgi:hypothetical protein
VSLCTTYVRATPIHIEEEQKTREKAKGQKKKQKTNKETLIERKPRAKNRKWQWQCGHCRCTGGPSQPRAAKKKKLLRRPPGCSSRRKFMASPQHRTPRRVLYEVSASGSAAATMSASPRMTATATAVSQQQP